MIEVAMEDIRFEPTTLSVAHGETIRFRFTNNGSIPHDAFLGDAAAQSEHEHDMATAATMTGMDPHAGHMGLGVTVDPGDTQTITYTFDDAGAIEIGCHQPGHYVAGMTIKIDVH